MDSTLILFALTNVVVGVAFILLAGLLPEPWRQRSMAMLVGFGSGLYWEGALGGWEYLPMLAGLALALLGLRWYPAIGLAWLVHTANDIAHHAYGDPLLASIPLSSFGCAVFDPVIAIWFFAGAPDLIGTVRRRRARSMAA
ncbi:DUF6010 family protein [Qipengyuania qiaonensis]|uniref:Integral membrane protein n=1 Tax=Qipengyuania qiaonensis TaxID=2867240 RepID=A0ABS7J349_9SPHN|nr:DUF6010 family protein [Qipengyuania qiaonensis]MBX7481697.1 hypothetical protein [Qipengyuania qiaonensis]